MTLAKTVLRWFGSLLLAFVVILLIIAFGSAVLGDAQQAYEKASHDLEALRRTELEAASVYEQARRSAERRLKDLESAPADSVQNALDSAQRELNVLAGKPIAPIIDVRRARIDTGALREATLDETRRYVLRAEIELLNQLLRIADAKGELERRRQLHVTAYAALQANLAEQARYEKQPWYLGLPFSKQYAEQKALERQEADLRTANQRAHEHYQAFKRLEQRPPVLSIATNIPEPILASVTQAQKQLHKLQQDNWTGRYLSAGAAALKAAAPVAFKILAAAIALALGIRLFLYFVLAPIVSRRPPIVLLPAVSGTVVHDPAFASELPATNTRVSCSVTLNPGDELLVHPEYLQSTPQEASTRTRWLLSRRFWLASVAADLVAVTCIRSDRGSAVVLSSTRDPLMELGVAHLPEGAAIVLHPRHLVGVLQPSDRPMQITSHWRLTSLHAWLTMQLRYLVLHGPVTLILSGCRGVRIEPARSGRLINRAATIGFSANLGYASRRSETFMGYLLGVQPLLHDCFAGSDGSYLYQEIPSQGGGRRGQSRGIEGFTDALLKVVGI